MICAFFWRTQVSITCGDYVAREQSSRHISDAKKTHYNPELFQHCAVLFRAVFCCAVESAGPSAAEEQDIMALVALNLSRDQALQQEVAAQTGSHAHQVLNTAAKALRPT
jgi:hypothetical protein